MGAAFETLPRQVRAFHSGAGVRRWTGVSDVRRGRGVPARMLAALFGFPRAGTAVPISVTIRPDRRGETWTRDFGGQVLRSAQWSDHRGARPLLVEQFGPVRVGSTLVLERDRLRIVPQAGRIFGIPIPRRLLPFGEAFETERDGRFCFDVSIGIPLVGMLVAYRGSLMPRHDDGDPAGAADGRLPEARAMRSQDAPAP